MNKTKNTNVILGLFVIVGIVILVVSIYVIGSKQNLFASTIKVTAIFKDVSGLQEGNNVRFRGIDVGTVKKIQILNDSSINVIMIIKRSEAPYIKKEAIANIATDGLMGNKIVVIKFSKKDHQAAIKNGDTLQSLNPIENDILFRTLAKTNENVSLITEDLKSVTANLRTFADKNNKNTLLSLLMDTVIAENVKSTVVNIKVASNQSAILTGNLKNISDDIRKGKGSLGALITDTSLSGRIHQVVVKLENVSDTAAIISGDISNVVKGIKEGKGSAGIFLKDTTFVHNLNQSMQNIREGTSGFNQNMEALKHTWPFKKYFRKKNKSR